MDWLPHVRRVIARIGEDATYTPPGGGGTSTVRGVYQQPYRLALDIVDSSSPTFAVIQADVPTFGRGALLLLRAVNFKVVSVEPDPVSGLTIGKLEKQ